MIVPTFAFMHEWAKRKGIKTDGTNEDLIKNPKVIARIEREVELFNAGYGNWEKLKSIRLLSNELSIDGGELTPTMKLKRKKIMEKYASVVKEIYG